jgi:ATP-dependent helicase/nuclease subunit A
MTYEEEAVIEHGAHRVGQAGRVEVWPLALEAEMEKRDIFSLQTVAANSPDVKALLAERIAKTIRHWLDSQEPLLSQTRSVSAGDILILVRKRSAFVPGMVRALKRYRIPVAGVDRLEITSHIAIMDMLALADFLLLPEDDLNLACVLKSPICNMDEDALFELAYGRDGASLWSRVRASDSPAARLLTRLLNHVDFSRPYELFAGVLEQEGARARFAARLGEEAFDPLEEFLTLALDYEQNHTPSMQGFLQWMRAEKVEIKRDMEQGRDAVRIMTVHGAKGLQAPIVFLPDTTSTAAVRGGDKVNAPYWFKRDGKPLVLWSPSKDEDNELASSLREARQRTQEEEFRRLLYVALTRAADRLYIAGWWEGGLEKVPEDCWYSWIDTALKPGGMPCPLAFSTEQMGYCHETPQSAVPERKNTQESLRAPLTMPPALMRVPPPEPFPPQPLVPSRDDRLLAAAAPEAAVSFSPAHQEDIKRFRRGNLVHRLLQFLPDTPLPQREGVMSDYLKQFAPEYGQEERALLMDEIKAVLQHPELAPVFAEGSLAEVALTGLVASEENKDYILNGRIDRLCVMSDAVWIIDYKTAQKPPESIKKVPVAYLRQMALYRSALEKIYPGRPVHAALLWTGGPFLMPLPPESLKNIF